MQMLFHTILKQCIASNVSKLKFRGISTSRQDVKSSFVLVKVFEFSYRNYFGFFGCFFYLYFHFRVSCPCCLYLVLFP